jgi:ubiquitin C-terminal hydrolase
LSSSCIIPPSGWLLNLGNTCYLNAQLQCVYHIPYIRELIIHLTTSYDSNKTRRINSITPALESLGHVFTSMKKKSYIQRKEEEETIHSTNSSSSRSNSVSTETLCKTLGIHVYEQQGTVNNIYLELNLLKSIYICYFVF